MTTRSSRPSSLTDRLFADSAHENARSAPTTELPQFARIGRLADLRLMLESTVAIYGLGSGGAAVAKVLAATGAGKLILCDHDTVSVQNIGTTQVSLKDVGRLKVEVVAEAVRDINRDIKVEVYPRRRDMLSQSVRDSVAVRASLTLHSTDSLKAGYDIAADAVRLEGYCLHFGTHPGNRSFELIGSGGPRGTGCLHCLTYSRQQTIAESAVADSGSFDAFHLSAGMRNAVAAYVAVGLLHHRAKSSLPIAVWGRAFEALPCWVGRLTPDGFANPNELFGDVPADVFFGVRPYREPLPAGWTCPVCGISGA